MLSADNADKEIFPLVDHFIAKERTQESEIDCETLLETILDTESEVTELIYRIQDLMLDDNELSEYLKNSTAFNMKLKKSKRKLQKFLEHHPESSVPIEIRRDAKRNEGVKLPKIVLRKFIGDPLDCKSFKETFETAVYGIEKFTYLKTYLDKSAPQTIEGFPLTNENYSAPWQLLDERYGNEQLIISWVTTKTANHPKPSKTIRNYPRFLASNHKLPGISYNQPQTTGHTQQPATKCIWLILSSKILELYSTSIFAFKLLENSLQVDAIALLRLLFY